MKLACQERPEATKNGTIAPGIVYPSEPLQHKRLLLGRVIVASISWLCPFLWVRFPAGLLKVHSTDLQGPDD